MQGVLIETSKENLFYSHFSDYPEFFSWVSNQVSNPAISREKEIGSIWYQVIGSHLT